MVTKLQATALPEVQLPEDYNDPVTYEPMTTAVLIPCGHSLNETTAIELKARNMGCPLERTPFTVYYPNINLRNIVKAALLAQPQPPADLPQQPVMKEGPSPIAVAHYERGKELFFKNEYEKAVNAFLAALILYPAFEKAQPFFEAALEAQKRNSPPSSSMAPAISAAAVVSPAAPIPALPSSALSKPPEKSAPSSVLSGTDISSPTASIPALPSSVLSKPPEKSAPFPDYLTQALNPAGRGKALIKAVESEILRDIRYLLSQETPLNGKDGQGRTPLLVACRKKKPEILGLLIQNGAPLDGEDAQAALASAIENGDRDIIKILVKEGIPLKNVKYLPNQTPLFLACQKKDPEILLLFILNGAPVDGEDATSALISAIKNGDRDIVKVLFKGGVPTMSKTVEQSSSFMNPYEQSYQESIKHCYPLEIVAEKGDIELLRFFLSTQNLPNGINFDSIYFSKSSISRRISFTQYDTLKSAQSKTLTFGDEALIKASEKGHLDFVRILLENGVDLDRKCVENSSECENSVLARNSLGAYQIYRKVTKIRKSYIYTLRFHAMQKAVGNEKLIDLLKTYTKDGIPSKMPSGMSETSEQLSSGTYGSNDQRSWSPSYSEPFDE